MQIHVEAEKDGPDLTGRVLVTVGPLPESGNAVGVIADQVTHTTAIELALTDESGAELFARTGAVLKLITANTDKQK